MAKHRFWVGIALLLSPLTGMVIASCGTLLAPRPSVEGWVTYHGQPLRGGAVVFVSPDPGQSSDMMGEIDASGHFKARPRWWNRDAERVKFGIVLFPDPRKADRERAAAGVATAVGKDVKPIVRLTSFGGPAPATRKASASSEVSGARPTPPARPLEVSIGAEQLHVDIDLHD